MSKKVLDVSLDIGHTPFMVEESYKKAFQDGVDEFYALSVRRDELNKELDNVESRMERVRQGVVGLAPLAGIDFEEMQAKHPDLFDNLPDPRIGITDAVREAIRAAEDTLTPLQIRDRVFRISPAVAGHKSPMASVHAVLRRQIEAGEIIVIVDGDEKTSYGWVPDDEQEARQRLTHYLRGNEKAVEEAWKGILKKRRKRA